MEVATSSAVSPREFKRHYLSASDEDIQVMLRRLGLKKLDDLFSHIPAHVRFGSAPLIATELSYGRVKSLMQKIAGKNARKISFIGDGLMHYRVHPIVPFVSNIRGLTTAYTPYQPERSQGTLLSHWIYQSMMATLTGFEAINSSLYDRSSALYEALATAIRLNENNSTRVLLCESILPQDLEVVRTMAQSTSIEIIYAPVDPITGLTDMRQLRETLRAEDGKLAAFAFPQTNHLGLLEDVDKCADWAQEFGAISIAIVDPILLATGGLKNPTQFGKHGTRILVGEAQHLALGPNFGGPGLGVFGVRFNEDNKTDVRATPGRYVGKALDLHGRPCSVMVLSTREQHIRREKATSNICSNQAFVATLVGASILARGEEGMAESCQAGRRWAQYLVRGLTACRGVDLAFPRSPCFNEFILRLPENAQDTLKAARKAGLHLGIDVSERAPHAGAIIKVSCTDVHTEAESRRMIAFFRSRFGQKTSRSGVTTLPEIPERYLRREASNLPTYRKEDLETYYMRLGELNVSPDDGCYPLGSCTMKYNPLLNDWAANLEGFTMAHPQAPIEDVQGCLQVLHEIQYLFKKITGLAAVTTQPVAGAQGELVGLKMFQAYHRDHSEEPRDVVFIPDSAHGTNFATAMMAGFDADHGIVQLRASDDGQIDWADFERKLELYGNRLAGIMVTNPNTSGIFETRFAEMAQRVHEVGGLVYMDGANMNAIAGHVNLAALGVDAVHHNLHKTWAIPHGGGGPGDAIVAVSERLVDYLPGMQIVRRWGAFKAVKPKKSIGSFHRHWGNFAHKVRCLAYLKRLGRAGVPKVSAMAVLSARYLLEKLRGHLPILPQGTDAVVRMHEFIVSLKPEDFASLESVGISKNIAMSRFGKLFLDFGYHAPTVSWPQPLGLMLEPTESYSRAELDRLADAMIAMHEIVRAHPETLTSTPHFTPVERIDDVSANRSPVLSEKLEGLPAVHPERKSPNELRTMPVGQIANVLQALKN